MRMWNPSFTNVESMFLKLLVPSILSIEMITRNSQSSALSLFMVTKENTVTFKRPETLHKARWLAKLLYSIQICLFEQQIADLPRSAITTQQQVAKVRDFVNCVTLVYSSWWMTCSSVRHGTIWSFHEALGHLPHLWYLTTERVPLALWSKNVLDTDRRALVDRLLAVKPAADLKSQDRYGLGFGRPTFPDSITATTTLADLVGSDSW